MVFSLNILSAAALAAAAVGLLADYIGLGTDAAIGFRQLTLVFYSALLAFGVYGAKLRIVRVGKGLRVRFSGSVVRFFFAGCIAVTAVVLRTFPAPYIWALLGWTAFCIWFAFRVPRCGLLMVHIAAACAALAVVEAYAQFSWRPERKSFERLVAPDKPFFVVDRMYGEKPAANRKVRATLYRRSGALLYSATYTIDKQGLRIVPDNRGADKSLLFFGCSFTYGTGVADEETMPYQAGVLLDDFQVYNFGFGAYGPHQMLAMVESGRVRKSVAEPPKHVVFQLIVSHIRRVSGHFSYFEEAPHYTFVGGKPVRRGRFSEQKLKHFVRHYARKSKFYKNVIEPRLVSHDDIKLTAAIIARAAELIREQFDGCSFDIIYWDMPGTDIHAALLAELKRQKLNVHLISDILPGPIERFRMPDAHPTSEAHRRIAEYVAESIVGADFNENPVTANAARPHLSR